MSWVCSRCNAVNANLNSCCALCSGVRVGIVSSADYHDLHDSLVNRVIIWQLEQAELGLGKKKMNENNMSPKEKLFAKFFSEERILISEMDDLTLKAHIEELQSIAFEARARLTASDDEARDRSAKKKASKGFATSVQSDDFTSQAIHNITERQKKMTKVEKEIERLVGMGVSREDAENMYKASTVLVMKKQGVAVVLEDNEKARKVKEAIESVVSIESKSFSNPFAPVSTVPVEIKQEETEIKELPKEESFNPFGKKG